MISDCGIKIESEAHWHELRAKNIGSSDAATLFDCNKFQSLYTLWCTKHGLLQPLDSGNERTLWGQRFEAPIAEGIAEDSGWSIKKAGYYQHPTVKGMGCTPDFIIEYNEFPFPGTDERMYGDGILEIKMLENWAYFGEFTTEEANHYIEVQLQHQLACTGLQWAALGAKMPGQTPEIRFFRYRDEAFIKTLEKKVVDFWASSTPPVPDGSDSASQTVRALYNKMQGKEIIDLSGNNEIPCLVGELEALKAQKKPLNAQIKLIETDEKAIKNQLMALSEGAEIVKFQGGEVKINTVNRGAVAPCSFQTVNYKLDKEEA